MRHAAPHQEAAAIACLFTGLVLLLSLISYSLPLLGQQPALQQPAENWCGHFGHYTARHLLSFLGVLPFSLALLFFHLAAAVLAAPRSVLDRLPTIIAGLTGILIAAAGLLAGTKQLFFPPEFIQPGGFLGSLIRHLLVGILGEAGSALFLLLLIIISLMAAIRFSPAAAAAWLWEELPLVLEKAAAIKTPLRKKMTAWLDEREQRLPSLAQNAFVSPAKKQIRPLSPAVIVQKLPFSGGQAQVQSAAPLPLPALKPLRMPVVRPDFPLPPLSLLDEGGQEEIELDQQRHAETSKMLLAKLLDFAVEGAMVGVSPGPVVTTYEFAPAAGIKINKIIGLSDDLAMALGVGQVRVAGSVPGKAAIGIEVPNFTRNTVILRKIFTSSAYQDSPSRLTVALGLDTGGRPVVADLARMPHLLIAGATGAGKSVAINAFICSILCKARPDEVRLLMIDPKRIELSVYEGIPHLLHPVVTEPRLASRALRWAVQEMERRYRLMEAAKVKSLASYNEAADEKLACVIIIVDELADLMMVAAKDVETSLARLAQMARAAGMHIILATQRPSSEVLTGLIKANFPTRIAFKVASKVDSRTILDSSGAEQLLGLGDMLFLPPGAAKLQRIHGAFISEAETERIIRFLEKQYGMDNEEYVIDGGA